MREKIDIHAHYFPPAYDQMLEKRGMKLLDGGFPKPEWNEEIQLSFMEKLGITYSVLSISSPHLHMGDVGEAIEVARSSNEYGAELMKKYPEQIGVLASLPWESGLQNAPSERSEYYSSARSSNRGLYSPILQTA